MVTFKNTRTTAELAQILSLQARNLSQVLSSDEQTDQGFVTVQHDLPLLATMAEQYGHVVARDDHRVIGYALVMLPEFKDRIAMLRPMFERLRELTYQGRPVPGYRYFVMGQVCIDAAYRGKGVFSGLYHQLKASMSSAFDLVITEVATRNPRSLRAHRKVGFQTLETYVADTGEAWNVLLWDLRDDTPDESGPHPG